LFLRIYYFSIFNNQKKKKKKKRRIKKKKRGISKYQTPTKPTRPDPTRPLTL